MDGMTEKQQNRIRIIRKAIASIEEKLDTNEMKPTVADLVRLLQIEKELEPDQPVELKVSWVESDETEPVS
jgi:hypothetical protein